MIKIKYILFANLISYLVNQNTGNSQKFVFFFSLVYLILLLDEGFITDNMIILFYQLTDVIKYRYESYVTWSNEKFYISARI